MVPSEYAGGFTKAQLIKLGKWANNPITSLQRVIRGCTVTKPTRYIKDLAVYQIVTESTVQ